MKNSLLRNEQTIKSYFCDNTFLIAKYMFLSDPWVVPAIYTVLRLFYGKFDWFIPFSENIFCVSFFLVYKRSDTVYNTAIYIITSYV